MRSDEALHEALCHGDLGAFDALHDRHARTLLGFIKRMLSDAHEAEDVLNETFLTLVRQRDAAAKAESLRAWLFTVARNQCLNRLRSQRRGARAIDAARDQEEPSVSPEQALEQKITADKLRAAIERLPEPMAALYHLRARGLAYDEIAAVLQVPVGTVKSRVHELVRRLREEIAG
jgi:RNA polymerase sigma factor (sigma-70 family)